MSPAELAMDAYLVGATAFATVSTAIFIALYSTLRWEASPIGRAVMSLALGVLLMELIAIVKRVDELVVGIDIPWLSPAISTGWLVIGIVTMWHSWYLWRARRNQGDEPPSGPCAG